MPRYMMFIVHNEAYRNDSIPQSLNDEMGEFVNEHLKSGVLVNTAGLQPTSKARRVRLSRGKLTVTDGPFTETKEVVGGYALVEARSTEEATEFATRFVDLHRRHWPEFECACEVRPLDGEELTAARSAAASESAAP